MSYNSLLPDKNLDSFMSTNYSYLLNFSVIHLQLLGILAVHRLQRKAIMRFLKREDEGGITLADWHGGFIGINKSANGLRHVDAWYESCPCCKGAFDLSIEVLGIEFMVYNDGGPCELQAFYEDFERNAIPKQPYTKPQISRGGMPYKRKQVASVTH